jgi:hypothetical protein
MKTKRWWSRTGSPNWYANTQSGRLTCSIPFDQVDAGLSPDQIAVITPYVLSGPEPSTYFLKPPFLSYQAQVTLLSSLLRPLYGTAIEIGSVDGMQGREKEAVIISLVRSNSMVSSVLLDLGSQRH